MSAPAANEHHDPLEAAPLSPATVPFVSVVVPHLDQPEALAACLRSLADQRYPAHRFEIIVVDNGSQSSPRAIVESTRGARLEAETARGPGPARNRGVAVARGEILAFIDADCSADPGWLEAIAQHFSSAPEGTVLGGDVRVAVSDPGAPTMLEAYESVFAYRQREYIEQQHFSGTGNLAVARRDFDRVGPFRGIEVAGDRDWGRRATTLGLEVVYRPEVVTFHASRSSFDDLLGKWSRHVRHDFRDWRRRGRSKPLWVLRGLAVALSPPVSLVRIARSDRIAGFRARALAFAALVRVRLFRCREMLRVARRGPDAGDDLTWSACAPRD